MRPNPPLQRCRYLDPTPSWDFGCESMIRNRRSRSRKAGTDLRSREAFTGRSSRRTSDPDPIRSIGSGSVARASNPEFLALSPCVGYRTTEWTIDLILVLLDTCRLKTEREEQTPAPWAIRSPGSSLAQIDAPNQLLASPRVRPMVLPVHAIEPRAIRVSPCAPTNKKPRIAPGLSEARCLLQGGVRAAFSQVSA